MANRNASENDEPKWWPYKVARLASRKPAGSIECLDSSLFSTRGLRAETGIGPCRALVNRNALIAGCCGMISRGRQTAVLIRAIEKPATEPVTELATEPETEPATEPAAEPTR